MKKIFPLLMVAFLAVLGIYSEGSRFLGFSAYRTTAPLGKISCPKPEASCDCDNESESCPPREPPILMPHSPPAPVLVTPEEPPAGQRKECPKRLPDLSSIEEPASTPVAEIVPAKVEEPAVVVEIPKQEAPVAEVIKEEAPVALETPKQEELVAPVAEVIKEESPVALETPKQEEIVEPVAEVQPQEPTPAIEILAEIATPATELKSEDPKVETVTIDFSPPEPEPEAPKAPKLRKLGKSKE